MKRLFFAVAAMTPSLAFAASGAAAAGDHHVDFSTLFFPALNFICFAALMTYVYKKFVAGNIRGRSVEIAAHIKRAAATLHESEAEYKELCERLSSIAEEKVELEKRFNNEGEKLAKMIVTNAHAQAARIEADTARQIQREINQAAKTIRAEVVREAAGRAREQLTQSLSVEDDKKLRGQALRQALT